MLHFLQRHVGGRTISRCTAWRSKRLWRLLFGALWRRRRGASVGEARRGGGNSTRLAAEARDVEVRGAGRRGTGGSGAERSGAGGGAARGVGEVSGLAGEAGRATGVGGVVGLRGGVARGLGVLGGPALVGQVDFGGGFLGCDKGSAVPALGSVLGSAVPAQGCGAEAEVPALGGDSGSTATALGWDVLALGSEGSALTTDTRKNGHVSKKNLARRPLSANRR